MTRSDYLVTFMVPLTIRIENVDDMEQAEFMALEKLVEADVPWLLDPTDFYVGPQAAPQDAPDEAHDLAQPSAGAESVNIWRATD